MLTYDEFRTGLTFRDVWEMIANRKYRRRHGVLGKWREIKLEMYRRYVFENESKGGKGTQWETRD